MRVKFAFILVFGCSVSLSFAVPPIIPRSTNYSLLAFHQATRAPATGKGLVEWGQEVDRWRVGISAPTSVVRLGEPVLIHTHIHNMDDSKPNYRSGPGMIIHQYQFTVIDSRKQVLLSTNEFLAYRRTHGDFRQDDPLVVERVKRSSLDIGPNEVVTCDTDLSRLFDLSQPGEYLVYMKCRQAYRIAGHEPPFFELKTGNLLLNIVAATPGAPGEPAKAVEPAKSPASGPARADGRSGQTTSAGAAAAGTAPTAASSGAKSGATNGGQPDVGIAQAGGAGSAGSGSVGSTPPGTFVSRTTGLAVLFALLGAGVLWWLFRGK